MNQYKIDLYLRNKLIYCRIIIYDDSRIERLLHFFPNERLALPGQPNREFNYHQVNASRYRIWMQLFMCSGMGWCHVQQSHQCSSSSIWMPCAFVSNFCIQLSTE